MTRDPGAKIGLRRTAGDIQAAVDEAVDQGSNDFGAVEDLAAPATRAGGELIEMTDLPVEEDNGHLRPGLLMDRRASAV